MLTATEMVRQEQAKLQAARDYERALNQRNTLPAQIQKMEGRIAADKATIATLDQITELAVMLPVDLHSYAAFGAAGVMMQNITGSVRDFVRSLCSNARRDVARRLSELEAQVKNLTNNLRNAEATVKALENL